MVSGFESLPPSQFLAPIHGRERNVTTDGGIVLARRCCAHLESPRGGPRSRGVLLPLPPGAGLPRRAARTPAASRAGHSSLSATAGSIDAARSAGSAATAALSARAASATAR